MTMKKTKGRQKIDIKKIVKKNDRMITFSKRKSGIYKKIIELSTLCGADIAFLVFSAAGNPFTFGSPSFEAVVERFGEGGGGGGGGDGSRKDDDSSPFQRTILDAHKKIRLNELSKQYTSLVDELDAEKERMKTLPTPAPVVETKEWWRIEPAEIPNDEILGQLLYKFEDLYENLRNIMEQRIREGFPSSSSSNMNVQGFGNGHII
ncbi:PREDICTED: agamous-like MADS-box protein AGL29 [Tarenaya hassleriana]|uniref:agamous-like MADS-box protein AGL29 n=1 Tax=Tarenaya hassleriana TaxID=28532 RepID=UPI00053C5E18|nr:PREDICTED: agamous-like MADS-box protein AGL29 [Tarenaya hassleriana]